MLDRKKWKEADALFEQALDLEESERSAFLQQACDDPEIRAHVERLLSDEGEDPTVDLLGDTRVLHDFVGSILKDEKAKVPELPGFRMESLLGEGGMGEVWAAEQLEPVRRPVAIKLIKQGAGSREVLKRFEVERQALALMSHRNIARVFDAGISPGGRPFFVMERVDGIPITEYCDEHRLTTRERLDLMVQVCAGIQHAHRKGVIHRDIKPMNVLVTVEDKVAVPKIIDFGIARATDQRLAEETAFTRFGQMVGTPEYMSPEQADGDVQSIDTRTDVYSLGVLLYELLVGVQPFDPVELRRLGFDAMRRKIRETDPPRPSTRLDETDERTTVVAQSRRTDAAMLRRQLRSDLDWVVMKALEKERDRRYESPNDLAADLRRHLADEPVSASPPSLIYRLRKLTRKHRLALTAASLIFLASVIGGAVSAWQAVRATRAEQVALNEAATAQQVSDFLVDLFKHVDPAQARGHDPKVSEILDRAGERIQEQLHGQPQVQARMMLIIGEIYRRIGRYDEALPLVEEALALRQDGDPKEALDALSALVRVHVDLADDVTVAEMLRELEQKTLEVAGPVSVEMAQALNQQGELARRQGRLDESVALHRRAAEIETELFGADSLQVAGSLGDVATALLRQGEFEEAVEILERTTATEAELLEPDHPRLAVRLSSLAHGYRRLGRQEEALEMQHRVVDLYRQSLGESHLRMASARMTLGSIYGSMGRLDEALVEFLKVMEIRKEIYGPDHLEVAKSYQNLATTYRLQGRLQDAEAHARMALEISAVQEGMDPFWHAASHTTLGSALHALARYEEAEQHITEARSIFLEGLGPEHHESRRSLDKLGLAVLEQGRLDEAAALFVQSIAIQERKNGPKARGLAFALDGLGRVWSAQGRIAEAKALHQRAVEISKTKGVDHASLPRSYILLGDTHLASGELDVADAMYREALRIAEKNHGDRHLDGAWAHLGIGKVSREQGDIPGARAALERALDIRRAAMGEQHPKVVEVVRELDELP